MVINKPKKELVADLWRSKRIGMQVQIKPLPKKKALELAEYYEQP